MVRSLAAKPQPLKGSRKQSPVQRTLLTRDREEATRTLLLRLPPRTILGTVEVRTLIMEVLAVGVVLQVEAATVQAVEEVQVVVAAAARATVAQAVAAAQIQEQEEARQVPLALPHLHLSHGHKDPTSSPKNSYGT